MTKEIEFIIPAERIVIHLQFFDAEKNGSFCIPFH